MSLATQQPECSGKGMARVDIRWMIRRDMPSVLNIEQLNFEFPWREDDFHRCLRNRNSIGMVAECRHQQIRGYMIYDLMGDHIHLLNFAVLPSWQRWGVGSQMVRKLVGKLGQRRKRITLDVRETNLPALLFFKSQGFRAVDVLRGFYEDTDEDAYRMQYRIRR